jgi:hypothetical protein
MRIKPTTFVIRLWVNTPETDAAMAKLPFRNSKGEIVMLDDKLTMEDLVKMGITLKLEPKELPRPTDPKWFIHDPAEGEAPK